MVQHIKIAVWNANGLINHKEEIIAFINIHNLDIVLISEAHFTERSFLKIPGFTLYVTQHPDGTAHAGTAIIIKNTIKHHELLKYREPQLQATSIVVEDWLGPLTISAVYCPPRYNNKQQNYEHYFHTLGDRFISGGDYNAKHTHWGSRITTTKGREMLKAINNLGILPLTTNEPTYWPTDHNKLPDLLDLCFVKNINPNLLNIRSCLDLSTDHSPILATLGTNIILKEKAPTLTNKHTNWNLFREIVQETLDTDIPLKSTKDLETAVVHFNQVVQNAARQATPEPVKYINSTNCPIFIKKKIAEKRRLRRRWQTTRHPADKGILNRASAQLKNLLSEIRNQNVQEYLRHLSPLEANDYSLWKATKYLKQPHQHKAPIRTPNNTWAKSDSEKARTFAEHLANVFTPFPTDEDETEVIQHILDTPYQMSPPIKPFKTAQIETTILKNVNPHKAPGQDLITGNILQELPHKGYQFITFLFNGLLRLRHFPEQWKVAMTILIPKPGKPPDQPTSYRPICLLPILSKVFEKLLLEKLSPIILDNHILPDHQFGFRKHHATIEQIHRVVAKITNDFEERKYCTATFLDVKQAFDKVWHAGLICKIKQTLPTDYFEILQSYLFNRQFIVRYGNAITNPYPVNSGVPQGSVLGPILYLIFTADLPTVTGNMVATFADDTAILTSNTDPILASQQLQLHLDEIQHWCNKWHIQINESKSVHVTYTLRRGTCPPVTLNNKQIPQSDSAKYLGIHLDKKLTWKTHIWAKRKQLGLKLQKMYWLIGRKSQLTLESKILLYKTMIKPIWTYGIQLWGTASTSNIEIIRRFQSKTLRAITNAPWYVPNETITHDLAIPTINEEIQKFSARYSDRISGHPNTLVERMIEDEYDVQPRLKRFKPLDLPHRFEH